MAVITGAVPLASIATTGPVALRVLGRSQRVAARPVDIRGRPALERTGTDRIGTGRPSEAGASSSAIELVHGPGSSPAVGSIPTPGAVSAFDVESCKLVKS